MRTDGPPSATTGFWQRAVSNSAWLTVDRLIRGGLNLVVLICIGRFLGPERFGVFSYALAFVAIFTAFASLAHEGILVRDLVRKDVSPGSILGTGLLLRAIGALIGLTAAVGCTLFLPGARTEAWLVVILSLGLLLQPLDIIDYWFQSQLQSRYTVWIRITAAVLIGSLKIYLALHEATLVLLAWVTIAEALLAGVGLCLIYRHKVPSTISWHFTRAELRLLFRESAPMAATTLLVLLFMKLDQIMLAWFLDFHTVGIYASAVRIMDLFNFLPLAILPSLFPVYVRLKKEHPEKLDLILQRSLLLFFVLSLGVVAVNGLAGEFLLTLLFGPAYAAAAPALCILSISAVFHYSAFIRAHWMFIEHRVIYHLWAAGISVAVLAGLNALLIPRYGLTGAAAATSIGYAVSGYATSFFFPALRPIARLQTRAFCLQWNPPRLHSETTQ